MTNKKQQQFILNIFGRLQTTLIKDNRLNKDGSIKKLKKREQCLFQDDLVFIYKFFGKESINVYKTNSNTIQQIEKDSDKTINKVIKNASNVDDLLFPLMMARLFVQNILTVNTILLSKIERCIDGMIGTIKDKEQSLSYKNTNRLANNSYQLFNGDKLFNWSVV